MLQLFKNKNILIQLGKKCIYNCEACHENDWVNLYC